MKDYELIKKVAEKCGIKYTETPLGIPKSIWVNGVIFDPLHDMNDLMNIVVPSLLKVKNYYIEINGDWFSIFTDREFYVHNANYPADFARKVCEALIKEGIL